MAGVGPGAAARVARSRFAEADIGERSVFDSESWVVSVADRLEADPIMNSMK